MFSVESRVFVLFVLRPSLEVGVWEVHGAEAEVPGVEETVEGEEVEDGVAEAAAGVLFHGYYGGGGGGEGTDEVDGEGLHETGVSDGHGDVGVDFFEIVRGEEGLVEASAEAEDRDLVLPLGVAPGACPDDSALSDFNGGALRRYSFR